MSIKKSKIKPLGNRVLVKRSVAKTTKGGIILPDSAQEKPKQGEIVAVGAGKVDAKGVTQKVEVSIGDTILFSSYAGTEFTSENDAEYLILNEEDIIAIIP